MNKRHLLSLLILGAASATAFAANAAPATYTLDPDHTHPSFEVDHFGGFKQDVLLRIQVEGIKNN